MYFLLLLWLCVTQTVETSLYYMHLTKNNIFYLYLDIFFNLWLSTTQKRLACRIWVCVCEELVLLLKAGLQICLEGERYIAFMWPIEQGSCSDDSLVAGSQQNVREVVVGDV